MKFDHIILEPEAFTRSLKIRIGVWAKELLGLISFSPTDIVCNVDSGFIYCGLGGVLLLLGGV